MSLPLLAEGIRVDLFFCQNLFEPRVKAGAHCQGNLEWLRVRYNLQHLSSCIENDPAAAAARDVQLYGLPEYIGTFGIDVVRQIVQNVLAIEHRHWLFLLTTRLHQFYCDHVAHLASGDQNSFL